MLSSICACTLVYYGSKLPALPTMGKPNIWLSGLLSAPLLPFTLDMLPRHIVPVARGDPSYKTHPRMSSMLDYNVLPMPWIRLCTQAQPNTSNMLDSEMCELCCELPLLPEPESKLVFCNLEHEWKVLLI